MKKTILILIVCLFNSFLFSQTITSVEYTINWQTAKSPVPIAGKGIYMLVNEGLALFDPATAKYKLFNQTDSNKLVSGLTGLVAHKDKILVHTDFKLYMLSPNGLLKDITPAYTFGGYNMIRHVGVSDNEITLTSGQKLFSYQNNTWKDIALPDMKNLTIGKALPIGEKYIVLMANSSTLELYDPETKKGVYMGSTYNSPLLFIPGQSIWVKMNDEINYYSADNKMMKGALNVIQYPGKIKTDMLSKTRSFKDFRLVLNEKQDVFIMSEDEAFKITVVPGTGAALKFNLQKTDMKPVFPKLNSEFVMYGNKIYEFGGPGIIARTTQKTDTLFSLINRSSGIEGYNMMMPNGYLYTRDATKIHWNNGRNGGSAELRKYVLDMTTDGKTNYILTENILYKEKSLGVFDSIAPAADNTMKVVAIDKAGVIWMASHKGITTVNKGKLEFIPSTSISGFPANQAVHDIGISPAGEIFISMSKVYKYKDKQMTEVTGSPSLVYHHYFDGKGNDYMAGSGLCFFYDGKEAKDLKKILQETYPDKRSPYIGAVTLDDKGRCWAIVGFLNQKAIVVFENGKPINIITDNRIILDPYKQKIFFNKQQMIITTEKGGWTTFQYR